MAWPMATTGCQRAGGSPQRASTRTASANVAILSPLNKKAPDCSSQSEAHDRRASHVARRGRPLSSEEQRTPARAGLLARERDARLQRRDRGGFRPPFPACHPGGYALVGGTPAGCHEASIRGAREAVKSAS